MYFSGIHEAYDYQTVEGWWVIYVTFPDQNFIDWMMDFPADLWISGCEKKPKGIERDWDYTILIKSPAAYLHFRSRWHTNEEYMICRADYDLKKDHLHYLYERSPNDQMFDDINIPETVFLT